MAMSIADPTESYLGDILKWYVPCGTPYPRMQKIATIFTVPVWFIVTLVFLTGVLALKISSHNDSYIYRHIPGCIYAVWAITLGISVPKLPQTPIVRTIFIFMVWYSFAISMIFQTFFTSILVDPGATDQIYSSEELLKSNLEYRYNDDLDNFIKMSEPENRHLIPLKRVKCTYKDKCFLDYFESQNVATVSFSLNAKFFVVAGLPAGVPKPKLCNLNDDIYSLHFAMYLAKGNPLVRPLNVIISNLRETGLLYKVHRDYEMSWRYINSSDDEVKLDSIYRVNQDMVEYFVFSLTHLLLAFYLLLFGLATSFLVMLAELLHYHIKICTS